MKLSRKPRREADRSPAENQVREACEAAREAARRSQELESDPGALSIPSADGYHYGDNHPWGKDEQTALAESLEEL